MTPDEARALHHEVGAIDLHADTAKLMDRLGYDLAERHDRPMPGAVNYLGHVDVPRLRDGGVAAQFFSFWTVPYPERGCAASVHRQLDALDAAAHAQGAALAWCHTSSDIRTARAAGKIGMLGGIEGGQALEGDAANVARFAARGVRYLGLLHFTANAIGAPAKGRGADGARGLSGFGHEVIEACEQHGMIVDLAHINRRGFFDSLAQARKPVFVSHTGVTGVHAHWRNIDDEQLTAVANNGGAVGIIFARRYLGGHTLEAVVDHLLHVLNVAGEDVPALGSDFDGFVVPPQGIEDVAQLPALTVALARRGVPPRVLEKIIGHNVRRVLDATALAKGPARHA